MRFAAILLASVAWGQSIPFPGPGMPHAVGFANGYAFCKVVTTTAAMVSGGSPLTNFTKDIILPADNDLRTVGNGGNVVTDQTNIGFYNDTTCSGAGTALNWEFQTYSPTTGALIAHVLRPSLSNSADDLISMYYGGTTTQGNSTATWNSNYAAVYHLADGTTLNLTDSTANALTLTNVSTVTATAAQVDGGSQHTLATMNYLTRATNAAYNTADYTLEAWVNFATATAFNGIVSHGASGNVPGHYFLYANATGNVVMDIPFVVAAVVTGSSVLSFDSTFYHVALTKSGNNYVIFVNGVSDGTATNATAPTASGQFNIGAYVAALVVAGEGIRDEVRISNVARTSDELLTTYRNSSTPATFTSVGTQITP